MYGEWGKLSPVTGWVVVVEDDPAIRKLMVDILTEIGLHSLDFDTADDALTYLLSMPDGCPLVIADHALPGQLQGAEFIKMVRRNGPKPLRFSPQGTCWMPQLCPSQRRTWPNPGLWMIW